MQELKSTTMKKESNRILLPLVLGLIIAFLFLYLNSVKALKAEDFKTGENLKVWQVENGSGFQIHYTHSVEKSLVVEKYKVAENTLKLVETEFKSYGAGLPSTTEDKFEITEDGFRIYDINGNYPSVIYRTGAEGADHRILINNKEDRFLDFSKERAGVEFSIGNMNLLKFIYLKLF